MASTANRGCTAAQTATSRSFYLLAIYLISQAKAGLSSLKRQLGVSTHRLSGAVQLDDAYLGRERAGGKAGRGSEHKVPFVVAAVSLDEQGRPMYLKLHLVSGFTSQAIGNWAKANLAPRTRGQQRWTGLLCRCEQRAAYTCPRL